MKVQVHLRADKLGNIARGRWRGQKSNPYAKVTMPGVTSSTVGEVELGKTEIIPHNLSPNWTRIFLLDHDETQSWTPLKITLYDSRSSADKENRHGCTVDDNDNTADRQTMDVDVNVNAATMMRKLSRGINDSISGVSSLSSLYNSSDPTLGEVSVEVSAVLKMEGQEEKCDLEYGGCLYVHITESIESNLVQRSLSPNTGKFLCHIRGLDLHNIEKGLLGLGAIDPYFELAKKYSDAQHGITRWVPFYRSEHIPDIINPYWHPFTLDLEKICHGNLEKELRITVYDYEKHGEDRWLGECFTSVEYLQKSITMHGNAGREEALSVMGKEEEEIGLIVVLQADIR